jgi:nucleoside 2-deoxyribosyltransferase
MSPVMPSGVITLFAGAVPRNAFDASDVFGGMRPRIYFAGPLFCRAERDYNERARSELEAEGYEVFLPQDIVPPAGDDMHVALFEADMEELHRCDVFVYNLDGRVPDEGAAVELGYAYAAGIPCFAIKTDLRVSEMCGDNAMITGILRGRTAGSFGELAAMIRAGLALETINTRCSDS